MTKIKPRPQLDGQHILFSLIKKMHHLVSELPTVRAVDKIFTGPSIKQTEEVALTARIVV
jgi:hypothetical protein